jgi:hypothetical protein
MRPDHEHRFQRIISDYLERPGGDYAELLRRGHVSSPEGVDPEHWRAEIRAQARKDKIRVTTTRHGNGAFAVRQRSVSDDELRSELTRVETLRKLAATARELGHDPGSWLRSGDDSIAVCARCDARIYVHTATPPVTDGEALTQRCPATQHPRRP